MKIDILSLFPEMINGIINESILKRAQENDIVDINIINFRDFSRNKHKAVDDYSYGGGAGMVLKPEPLFEAVESIKKDKNTKIIMLSPQGSVFNQAKAEELSKLDHIIMICGHYEGFDERIRQTLVDEEISIGDYVLTGGELGALVITDAVVRLLPGALGKEDSHQNDSFSTGLLEYPQYTRPADFRGLKVPDVLLSGNHKLIEEWRRKESLKRTYIRRPDLLDEINLSDEDKKMLEDIKGELYSEENNK